MKIDRDDEPVSLGWSELFACVVTIVLLMVVLIGLHSYSGRIKAGTNAAAETAKVGQIERGLRKLTRAPREISLSPAPLAMASSFAARGQGIRVDTSRLNINVVGLRHADLSSTLEAIKAVFPHALASVRATEDMGSTHPGSGFAFTVSFTIKRNTGEQSGE